MSKNSSCNHSVVLNDSFQLERYKLKSEEKLKRLEKQNQLSHQRRIHNFSFDDRIERIISHTLKRHSTSKSSSKERNHSTTLHSNPSIPGDSNSSLKKAAKSHPVSQSQTPQQSSFHSYSSQGSLRKTPSMKSSHIQTRSFKKLNKSTPITQQSHSSILHSQLNKTSTQGHSHTKSHSNPNNNQRHKRNYNHTHQNSNPHSAGYAASGAASGSGSATMMQNYVFSDAHASAASGVASGSAASQHQQQHVQISNMKSNKNAGKANNAVSSCKFKEERGAGQEKQSCSPSNQSSKINNVSFQRERERERENYAQKERDKRKEREERDRVLFQMKQIGNALRKTQQFSPPRKQSPNNKPRFRNQNGVAHQPPLHAPSKSAVIASKANTQETNNIKQIIKSIHEQTNKIKFLSLNIKSPESFNKKYDQQRSKMFGMKDLKKDLNSAEFSSSAMSESLLHSFDESEDRPLEELKDDINLTNTLSEIDPIKDLDKDNIAESAFLESDISRIQAEAEALERSRKEIELELQQKLQKQIEEAIKEKEEALTNLKLQYEEKHSKEVGMMRELIEKYKEDNEILYEDIQDFKKVLEVIVDKKKILQKDLAVKEIEGTQIKHLKINNYKLNTENSQLKDRNTQLHNKFVTVVDFIKKADFERVAEEKETEDLIEAISTENEHLRELLDIMKSNEELENLDKFMLLREMELQDLEDSKKKEVTRVRKHNRNVQHKQARSQDMINRQISQQSYHLQGFNFDDNTPFSVREKLLEAKRKNEEKRKKKETMDADLLEEFEEVLKYENEEVSPEREGDHNTPHSNFPISNKPGEEKPENEGEEAQNKKTLNEEDKDCECECDWERTEEHDTSTPENRTNAKDKEKEERIEEGTNTNTAVYKNTPLPIKSLSQIEEQNQNLKHQLNFNHSNNLPSTDPSEASFQQQTQNNDDGDADNKDQEQQSFGEKEGKLQPVLEQVEENQMDFNESEFTAEDFDKIRENIRKLQEEIDQANEAASSHDDLAHPHFNDYDSYGADDEQSSSQSRFNRFNERYSFGKKKKSI